MIARAPTGVPRDGRRDPRTGPVGLVWGTGLGAIDPGATTTPSAWPGRNLLGFALTQVRERLA